MEYGVRLTKQAENFLKKLDKKSGVRVRNKLRQLGRNPRLGKPLTANLSGMWSLRIGKYRSIYTIEDDKLVVLIIDIGHRKGIYD